MDLVSILVAGTLVLLPTADDADCWNYLLDLVNLERSMPGRKLEVKQRNMRLKRILIRYQGFMLHDAI